MNFLAQTMASFATKFVWNAKNEQTADEIDPNQTQSLFPQIHDDEENTKQNIMDSEEAQ